MAGWEGHDNKQSYTAEFNYKPLDSEYRVYRSHEGRHHILFTVCPMLRTMLGTEKILNKQLLKE